MKGGGGGGVLHKSSKATVRSAKFRMRSSRAKSTTMKNFVSYFIQMSLKVYSDRTRQRKFDGVKHNALVLEHMLINRSIHTGRVGSKILYNSDAVDLTLARLV